MVQAQQPFKFQEVFNLTTKGLNPANFKMGLMTFESQKYICVKEDAQVAIVDTTTGFSVERRDMKADGILMHRERKVIAVRAPQGDNATVIQVLDLAASSKLVTTTLNEKVVFWRWISDTKLALVGATSVYHLDITQGTSAAPVKIFDRLPTLANCQIMSYDVDATEKWCYLIGLYSDANRNILSHIQLYSIERSMAMPLEGYAACFAEMPVTDAPGAPKTQLFCFCERKATETTQKFICTEIGTPPAGQQKFKSMSEIQLAPDAPGDFPMIVQAANKFGLIFVITKAGYFYMYEASRAALVYRQKITQELVVCSVRNTATDGMIAINKAGQVLAINVDEANLVPYVMNAQHIPDQKNVAFKLASRYGLQGADDVFMQQFNMALASSDYAQAARVAQGAPGTLLRNQDTINKFKALPPAPGASQQPIMLYFSTLLETGATLNEIESLELARPVLQAGKSQLIEQWMAKNQLTMSDSLGDVIRQYNPQMALKVFQASGSPDKVIQGLVETNQFDKILPYCQQTNYKPDWIKIMRQMVPQNPQAAGDLAKMITARDPQGNPKTPIEGVLQIFLEFSRVAEATAFLLEALKGNLPNEGHLQTQLFEINLMSQPNVAEGLFQLKMFTHFDKERIAKRCEQVGLYGRALQNFTNIDDCKRVMLNSHVITKEIMMEFFARLAEEEFIACLNQLMTANRQNAQLCAEISVANIQKLDSKKVIAVLESFGTNEGLLFFLMNVLPHTQDHDIYFKYIECCARMGNFKEVERVIKETTNYDALKVRDFLMEGKFGDPRPLIYLCDMHGYIEDLTRYLYNTKQMKCIEIFLFKVNSNASPKVLGTLLELDCDEAYIKQLLLSIRVCPIDELVENFETRGKLRMLTQWLEARYEERIQEPSLHNALAKIYIDSGSKDAQSFLINNQFYDSHVIGKYCEDKNPDLAFTAYKRAWGKCDDELIEVTNKNYLYRMQARYLVERQSEPLWAKVLQEDNPHRQQVIDQVVQTALPETKNVDEVSLAVRAFIDADLPNQLIELLERIVLHNSDFAENQSLQNLLILTAIRADTSRVMDYINRLNNYNGDQLATMALDDDNKLYAEALCIYKKFNQPVDAIKVILYKLENIRQATEFAEKTNKPEVWSELGKAQLAQRALIPAIDAFIKANDAGSFEPMIELSKEQYEPEELIKYLLMARANMKDQRVDNELIFAYAKGGEKHLGDLESFVSDPNQANIEHCGDRCFDDKLYQAAEILYKRISNNQKLAQTYVNLKKYQLAFEAAKKADVPKVWKAVCFACVRAKEFNMAALCGQHIIIHPDHLEDLNNFYEKFGYFNQLISLLESGMNLERTHQGIYTDLGIMYAKYSPERLMDFLKAYNSKLMIPRLIRECERYQMWAEAVYMHSIYEQQDQAIITMIEHSPSAWKHDQFCQSIVNVANHDLLYKAMLFYLEEEPMLLNGLLKLLAQKLDLTKTVTTLKKTGHIALISSFLESVQNQNIAAVNEALNEIYLENQDFDKLRQSIKEFDSFESVDLASGLENHELLECRRISSLLYRKSKNFKKSIELSKRDEMYQDAMETVAESREPQLAEELLRFIMTRQDKELVGAMLYNCYELIKPDVAMEVAWRCGLQDFVMPYFIQFVRDLDQKVTGVQKNTEDIKKKEEAKAEEAANRPLDMGMDMGMMFPGMGMQTGPAAIMPAPGSMGAPGGMGMGAMGNAMGGMSGMGGNMGGF